MQNLKHVGRIVSTGRKCIVAYRTLPGESDSCLIVTTENLSDSYHDSLINLVESSAGQDADEFAEVMARAQFSDGSTILPSLHVKGKLVKVPTSMVEMTPNNSTTILLSELNQKIAEQRGCAVDDLAIKPSSPEETPRKVEQPKVVEPQKPIVTDEPNLSAMSDKEKATYYRLEASKLSMKAGKLRKLADSLYPPVQVAEVKETKPKVTRAKAKAPKTE